MIEINNYRLDNNGISHGASPMINAGPVPIWGDIVGDITKQKDLITLLDSYVDEPELLMALLNSETDLKRWVEEQGYLTEHNLDGYAKKTDIPSLEGYATESWVEDKGYLTEHQDISGLATKAEVEEVEGKIPSLEGYATEDFVTSQGYLTEHQPLKTINGESVVGVGNIEISGSLTPEQEAEIAKIKDKADKSEIPSLEGYATESWVEDKGYLTEHQDISGLATKAEVEEVEAKIPSLDGYATESWVEDKGYLTEHQSLDDCIKKSQVEGYFNLTVDTIGRLKCKGDYTPSSAGSTANVASLGTVRNFYNDLKGYVDGLIGELNTITEDILS